MRQRHSLTLLTALFLGLSLSASAGVGWDEFDEAAHVEKTGRPILAEPVDRDMEDAETRLLGHWRLEEKERVREAWFGKPNEETGRGRVFLIDSAKGKRTEQSLIWAADLRKSDDEQLLIRYYTNRDEPVPLMREMVKLPKNGKTLSRRGLTEARKNAQIFYYVSQNQRPPRKVRRGFVEQVMMPDSDEGLRAKLINAAERLTLAYRGLRKLNDDVIAAKWDPPSKEKRKRRLRRFTAGELKRAKEGFKKACAKYAKRYDREEARSAIMEAGYSSLLRDREDVFLPAR